MTQQAAQPVTQARAIWLMTKMRLTRQRNMLANNLFGKFRKKKARDGIAGKKSSLWVLTALLVLVMSFSFTGLSRNVLLNMNCHLVASSHCNVVDQDHAPFQNVELAAAELRKAPFQPELLRGLTMVLTLLFGLAVLLPLGSKELAQPDWDLEWLVTMPVERPTLLWGRLLERSAANFSGVFALMPPLGMIAWYSGLGWFAPLAALAALLVLLPLAALLHTLADTGLRMWLPASQLRNLQAITGLFSMPLIYFVMALGMPNASGFVMDWARAFPAWTGWTPPGLVLQAMQASSLAQAGQAIALLLAQTAVLLWAGVALMRHQLRNGVVNAGSRESVRRKPQAAPTAGRRLSEAFTPIKRRELRLLSRDRNFLVQTLLLPVIIVVSQLVFNGKLNSFAELGVNHVTAATIAFGIGVYMLMLSAFQTLNNEGQVLWLLYTVPRSIESVLKEKAQLWGMLTLIYPLIIVGISAWYTTHFEWSMLALLLIVFAGIPIYSLIAVSLGVFACDPLAVDARARVRPTYIYLYMLLASFYTWSIYSDVWSQKLVVMVLVASMALALWQKARDALPYLLDPAAAPPPRVSTSDGLIAATAFFIMQGLIALFMMRAMEMPAQPAVTIAFAAAGLLVYLLIRFIYWRSKTAGVPAVLRGGDMKLTLGYGAMAAFIASAVGLAYLTGLQHSALWADIAKQSAASASTFSRGWLLALAVLAAPLCEEFIFRGLIYGGLRRSMSAMPAMAMSAAIFAVVHPPTSMLPVFVLGLCAAWTYERSKTLLGPMLVHAVYNAVVLSWQFWM
ncbi:CPBP family intramembrane metalloprotease [Duganella sp. BJB488]|uniref:CPBP family intramembrane glutamic endopeptidase n=1 Tax=unclassified Duganella TaxID=2636909 RepID=UPI000E34D9F6|nr:MULTISPECIES: type II CAAX endopeptidase family protein [unclassified Duganella]RFP22908.1 CPBP family intramembrane metalloprotease [Duganella sp. BJB489]RFP25016.1 CPBP family intramembrane metalloprotease [Duganella sp. BJB488]RFP33907.1 CPBP family intramembrane metalloprotease [Duganella sp. BJB480]